MKVKFSGSLLRFVNYERTVDIDAETLGDVLRHLHDDYPELRPVLWDADGRLAPVHRLVVNDELVTEPDLATPLGEADHVAFLTAIAGG
ncbi:MoaD/ThiS family protein [Streptomyces sp. NPDC053427]|uniref:MoaD/ThiS family protein n=1 Tax=Streptomyces sp. NPDC053427 TaxID=3365701 RepID=UPI0037D44454